MILYRRKLQMVFADKLQSLRKSKGLSQEELAEKCSVSQRPLSFLIGLVMMPVCLKVQHTGKNLLVATTELKR